MDLEDGRQVAKDDPHLGGVEQLAADQAGVLQGLLEHVQDGPEDVDVIALGLDQLVEDVLPVDKKISTNYHLYRVEMEPKVSASWNQGYDCPQININAKIKTFGSTVTCEWGEHLIQTWV